MVTPANVAQIPGLKTLGISLARVDYAPYGLNPPHTHPRPLQRRRFRLPEDLIHFQLNVEKTKAVAIAALSSQNPGVITIANAVFGSSLQFQLMFLQRPSKWTEGG
ncbi:putative germin-like protein 2-3 [Vitis vinifera]|uniref:Germin-like protein n=1 Tax=Vitis vinifera TaxID=29760 RepID=A0A438GZE3_VITVI|nr:putative germin-like protein 2-3 [Vitis vinifera]